MHTDTLSQAIEGFFIVRAVELSPTTADLYRWALGKLCDHLGDPPVKTVNIKDLQGFINYISSKDYKPVRMNGNTDPLAPRSVENAWTAMRSFFKWATVEYRLKKNPALDLTRPKYEDAPIIPFSEEEVVKLLQACEYTNQATPKQRQGYVMRRRTASRDIAIISVLLDTCVRASELSRMNIGDLRMDKGEIVITQFGTGVKTAGRTVPIGTEAKTAIWRYLNTRKTKDPEEPLFLTDRGKRMSRNAIRQLLGELGDKAGVPDCHPHRFRHTGGVFYLRNGGDLETLRKIMGHRDLEMTRKYLELVTEDVKNRHRIASPLDGLRKKK